MPIEHPSFKVPNEKVINNLEFLRPGSPIKKNEFIRIIIQFLKEQGYNQTVETLENESGIKYEEPHTIQFRNSILTGDWKTAESLLQYLKIKEKNYNECLFNIRQQKYLELLEKKRIKKALIVLRRELAPLQVKLNTLYELSSYIMYTNIDDIKKKLNWSSKNSRLVLLNVLQKYISPSVMIPKHRLEALVEQSLQFQKDNCLYHNTNEKIFSLYTDHKCLKEKLPNTTSHILESHYDEVWNVCFSPDGKWLASGSKDCTVIIWDTTNFNIKCKFIGHTEPISNMYWNPDGTQLLTCSNDKSIRLWDIKTENILYIYEGHTEGVTSCAWLPCGTKFVSAGLDKRIFLWSINNKIILQYPCSRVIDLAISKNGTRLITANYEKKIQVFNVGTGSEIYSIDEVDFITSLCLSNDSRYALVNLRSIQEIHLWDLEEKQLIHKYTGQKQGRFVIRSCFGGLNQNFIVSGSEDGNIYIWNRNKEQIVSILTGHTELVNSVAWHPTRNLLVSSSDDNTIRCWEGHIEN